MTEMEIVILASPNGMVGSAIADKLHIFEIGRLHEPTQSSS